MNSVQTNQLLSYILEILQLMVESGAEIYRVEESAQRMFSSYGVGRVDVYATTSNIIVSLEVEDGVIKTHTRRISQISTDIEKMHRLNSLVREMSSENPDLDYIKKSVEQIKNTPNYSTAVVLLFYGIIAGAFYLFFGGRSFIDLGLSIVIGLVVGIVTRICEYVNANKFIGKFLGSFLSSAIAFMLNKAGIIESMDYIIIGNIMTLIPGIGLTNALRDLFTGDSISGSLRLIEVTLLALSIACGYLLTIFLFGGVF